MICCSFVFEPGAYDDEFHQLDSSIAEFAATLPGFVRVERWQSADGRFVNASYFFADRQSVTTLAKYPDHQTAKSQYSRWYHSYRVDIMEMVSTYSSKPPPAI